ncbi:hypothetical protein M9Y10_031314 [Tritrichomonas musculus]|uniref:Uncharacterized protein n=1 Tax=Tritrichomonas musculus TaxID=1915356 RepID=A0ABR2H1E8_9EUKA
MRSDLNMVSNNVDVMTFDMDKVKKDVDILNYEMAIQQAKTQYIESSLNSMMIRSKINLAFSIPSMILGAASLCMSPTVMDFGQRLIDRIFHVDVSSEAEMSDQFTADTNDEFTDTNDGTIWLKNGINTGETVWRPGRPNPSDPFTDDSDVSTFSVRSGPVKLTKDEYTIEDAGYFVRGISQKQYSNYMNDLKTYCTYSEDLKNENSIMTNIIQINKNILKDFPNLQNIDEFWTNNYSENTLTNNLTPLIEWCNSNNNKFLDESKFLGNWDNPNQAISSVYTVIELIEEARNSLKLPFKMLAYQILENTNDFVKNSEIDSIISNKITEIQPSSESNFTIQSGFPNIEITNDKVKPLTRTLNGIECNLLKITIDPTRFLSENLDIFKIILRKDVIFDSKGRYIKEFKIYSANRKIHCPIVIFDEENKCCIIEDEKTIQTRSVGNEEIEENEFYIAFDKKISIVPYELWLKGDLSIMNLFKQTALVSNQPVIKCDIIEAENALKLHKSDVHYFYKPSIISEDDDYYKMIFEIPSTYSIPLNLTFSFKEYCFGNQWSLTWDGTKWNGNNIQARMVGKVVNKLNRTKMSESSRPANSVFVMIKKTPANEKLIPKSESLPESLIHGLFQNTSKKFELIKKDGTKIEPKSLYWFLDASEIIKDERYPDYSIGKLNIICDDYSNNNFKIEEIDEIHLYIETPGYPQFTVAYTFKANGVFVNSVNKKGHFGLIPLKDTIESLELHLEDSLINENNRNIELYLRKDFTNPIEEINWDSKTNAFKYIIDQQFYDVSPNPNAATTLYTDFNITSSKIITADNITTMRSDLNVLRNNFDVVSYDVQAISNKVDVLNSEMVAINLKTSSLEYDEENTRMISYVALAFGIAGTVGSAISIGMQINPNCIKFPTKTLSNTTKSGGILQRIGTKLESFGKNFKTWWRSIFKNGPYEIELEEIMLARGNQKVDLTPLIEWCEKEYEPLPDETMEDDFDDPEKAVLSIRATEELCNQFRDSLKKPFKLLASKIEEIDNNDYIKKSDLIRSDTIDIITHYQDEQAAVLFQAEDELINGICVFKLFTSEGQKQLYFKIEEGEIIEYKGVDTTTTIDDITIEGKEKSEEYRTKYLSKINKIDKNVIITGDNQNYKIVGCIIEKN